MLVSGGPAQGVEKSNKREVCGGEQPNDDGPAC